MFSIIVPVWNRAGIAGRTLASIAAQTYRPLQLVLVDNDSTDGTLDVLRAFKRVHERDDFEILVTGESRHSAGAARNRGLSLATGGHVLFFDSDDTMAPTLVERYHETFASPERPDIVVVARRFVDADGHIEPHPLHKGGDQLARHLLHSTLATQAFAVSRPWLDRCGTWDEELPAWNDLEMGCRLLLPSPRLAWIDEPLVDVRSSGEASITGTGFSTRHGQWELSLDKIARDIAAAPLHDVRRYMRLVDYRRLALAAAYEREQRPDLSAPLKAEALAHLGTSLRLRLAMPWLYRRMVAGRRGSARVARLLI